MRPKGLEVFQTTVAFLLPSVFYFVNEFVNLVENFVMPGHGKIDIEGMDCFVRLKWDDAMIYCFIRVYTFEGWKEYEKELKR